VVNLSNQVIHDWYSETRSGRANEALEHEDIIDSKNYITDSSYRPYMRVDQDQSDLIIDALNKSKGNKTLAAHILGLTVRQLRYRISKLELES